MLFPSCELACGFLIKLLKYAYTEILCANIKSASEQVHHGELCSGVNWNLLSLEDICDVASSLGGSGLASICSLFAWGTTGGSGLPDLLLWRDDVGETAEVRAKLVEVKGPRDTLSEDQRAWLTALDMAGLCVEVCKVHEPARHAKRG